MESIEQSFEILLSKFDENNTPLSNTITSVKELLQSILHSNEKNFSEADFLNHQVFFILRDWYLNLLRQWRQAEQLDETAVYVFETIPHLFLKISNYTSEKTVNILKELLYYKPILEELNLCLEEIASNGKLLQDLQIKSLDNFFRAIQRLERNHLDNQTDPLLINLFDNIVKCICSSSFMNIFLHSITQENDHPGQKFLLHTCTDYIYSHPTDQQHKQSLLRIRQSLLRPFSQWLCQQSSSFRSWNHRVSLTLRQLCFILTLSIQLHQSNDDLDRDSFNSYCQLIDSFVNILYSILQTENSVNQKLTQSLLSTLIPNLYTMTLSDQLTKYLKSKHIISLLVKLVDIENDEIQLNTFRILSATLTEQDTKILSNSTNIINLFLKFLSKIIDDPNQILRFYNLLRCLKHIVHYDQIKDELTKQNAIPLLLRCATETKFKPLQAQQPALEILLALTFNQAAYRQLKENLNHLKPLLSSSHQCISRAADNLLWRLEKEEEEILGISKVPLNTWKYDLMISYSHANKDFVYRIYDQLLKDDLRIWIDSDETFGTTMTVKANIIDQSQSILICMSDEYKQNSFCRSEAFYAHQCQYQIIPLIFSSNFHPDGWLYEIIKGKIYIDFIKLEFDLAYQSLKNEVNRNDLYQKVEQTIISVPKIEYSFDIQQWTNEQVKSFLIDNRFDCLTPIISDMNGCLLYDLYQMCEKNRESMFHTLKTEISLLETNLPPLTILVYLRFLREIEKLITNHSNQ